MPLSSSNAVKQLSDGNSIGTILGQSSTDLIGFYGVTQGVARANASGSLSSGAFASTVAAALVALGLITMSSVTT